jgi:energy-coupling factor transporter ATP-binding protein EcfA2
MTERLFVGVLGHRNSGKSTTWNTLFGATVRTGQYARTLTLYGGECVEIFLISGSPEERQLYAGDILKNQDCRIVLCSIQYIEAVRKTLDYVVEEGFESFIQWLNPGRNDNGENFDRLGLMPWLLGQGATVSMRDGKTAPSPRTEEIRQVIHGWAKARGLTFQCPEQK